MISVTLVSHPEVAGVRHFVEVIPATENPPHPREIMYPQKISDIVHGLFGSQTEMYCPECDALMKMPAGSVTAYLYEHLTELGGEDALVEVRFHHRGPRPATPPRRYKRVEPKDRRV